MWKRKITAELGTKSLGAATKEIDRLIGGWKSVTEVFLMSVFNRFKELANGNLDGFPTPYNTEIKESWTCEIDHKTGVMRVECLDPHGKSAALEFGVGIVAKSSPHANAAQAGYEYNKASGRKDSTGAWIFTARMNQLDMWDAASYFLLDKGKGRYAVFTRGEPATMFAYNALMDLPQSFPALMESALKTVYGE